MNIAIDGPAGAGKSSIAKLVAQKLSFVYFDTGAMYRTIALYALEHQINPAREEDVVAVLDEIQITLSHEDGEQEIFLNGTNVSKDIRREEVGKNASIVAKYAAVRQKLVSLQQEIAADMDVIMDGRDIGTVVLPNAEVKIYLTASANVRAKRRFKELQAKGESCDLTQIEKDIIARDEQDMNREISPLRQAEDAVLVDSSDMTIEEVVNCLIDIIKKKM
ncbi:MAG: (d)CMP kinase [Clostridiales bacterium]|nr:(d)CMP kinase [Eubacterium sp.]MDD7349151.1 (d)CMP kinase [Clostridiales bacterium]